MLLGTLALQGGLFAYIAYLDHAAGDILVAETLAITSNELNKSDQALLAAAELISTPPFVFRENGSKDVLVAANGVPYVFVGVCSDTF